MAATPEINILVCGESKERFERLGVRVVDEMSAEEAERIKDLFVLSTALALPEVAEVIKAANRRKHLRGLLVEHDHDPHWITTMLDRAGLRTLRNTLVHTDPAVFERILNAWRIGAQEELIADATLQSGRLFIKSCALDTFEVAAEELKPLRNATSDELLDFVIAEDGAYIHWPRLDAHLDLEAIRVAGDPELRSKLRAERLKHDAYVGAAIRALRETAGLRQKDIGGLSARQVRRIEKGARPRSETLACFADAHDVALNEYLNRLAEEMRRLRSESH